MKPRSVLLWLIAGAGLCAGIFGEPPSTESPSTKQVLLIDQSSIPVSGGRATLTISPLRPSANVYAGDYHMKVSPYFFKSEKGKLAISIPDESFAKVARGAMAEVTGTAISEDGESRCVTAQATPLDDSKGVLKLWFIVGNRKMIFDTMYRFQK